MKWRLLIVELQQTQSRCTVVSDASGSWGCGAFSLPNWFNLQWSPNIQIFPIAVKELFPVVIAAAIYRNQWSGKLVHFKVDNLTVASSGSSSHVHTAKNPT